MVLVVEIALNRRQRNNVKLIAVRKRHYPRFRAISISLLPGWGRYRRCGGGGGGGKTGRRKKTEKAEEADLEVFF